MMLRSSTLEERFERLRLISKLCSFFTRVALRISLTHSHCRAIVPVKLRMRSVGNPTQFALVFSSQVLQRRIGSIIISGDHVAPRPSDVLSRPSNWPPVWNWIRDRKTDLPYRPNRHRQALSHSNRTSAASCILNMNFLIFFILCLPSLLIRCLQALGTSITTLALPKRSSKSKGQGVMTGLLCRLAV